MTFIEYLENLHFTFYPQVTDDEMPEHFRNWMDNLGAWECAEIAEKWRADLLLYAETEIDKEVNEGLI